MFSWGLDVGELDKGCHDRFAQLGILAQPFLGRWTEVVGAEMELDRLFRALVGLPLRIITFTFAVPEARREACIQVAHARLNGSRVVVVSDSSDGVLDVPVDGIAVTAANRHRVEIEFWSRDEPNEFFILVVDPGVQATAWRRSGVQ